LASICCCLTAILLRRLLRVGRDSCCILLLLRFRGLQPVLALLLAANCLLLRQGQVIRWRLLGLCQLRSRHLHLLLLLLQVQLHCQWVQRVELLLQVLQLLLL
jgi:hypothetical protein